MEIVTRFRRKLSRWLEIASFKVAPPEDKISMAIGGIFGAMLRSATTIAGLKADMEKEKKEEKSKE